MAKVCVATLHTGNTLTIHGHTFFKGRPTVVTEQILVDYLKGHPNFKVEERIVASSETPEQAQESALQQVRQDMKEGGEYLAPKIFEKDTTDTPTGTDVEESTPVSSVKSSTTRKGAVSAPRPVSKG